MLLGAYIPTWDGALQALPGQCVLAGVLALALGAYACQGRRPPRVALALGAGLLTGLAAGVGWVWWGPLASPPSPFASREQRFEWNTIAFFELGYWQAAACAGLVAGWLVLQVTALVSRGPAPAAEPGAAPDRPHGVGTDNEDGGATSSGPTASGR